MVPKQSVPSFEKFFHWCVNMMKKFHKSFEKNEKVITAYSTIAIIVVTAVSVWATFNSVDATIKATDATNRIVRIELLLASEERKLELNSKINLAKELLIELTYNYVRLTNMYTSSQLLYLENTTEIKPDLLRTDKIKQAIDYPGFGSDQMKIRSQTYDNYLYLLKADLLEIERSENNNDREIKKQRIIHFNDIRYGLMENENDLAYIPMFLNVTQQYVDLLGAEYANIDSELGQKLLFEINYSK